MYMVAVKELIEYFSQVMHDSKKNVALFEIFLWPKYKVLETVIISIVNNSLFTEAI